MRILLPTMLLSLALLGGGCAKEVCPGEITQSQKYNSPVRFNSARETRKKAKPSMIHISKSGSSSKRKPPPPPVYYSESNNAGKRKSPK